MKEPEPIIETTRSGLVEALTEWDRRYREEPERFLSEAVRLLKTTPSEYGDSAADYLIGLLSGEV